MQEQKGSKAASIITRLGLGNIIWLSICTAMVLGLAIVWLWPYRLLPTASWREADSTLPWADDGIVVKEVKGRWESSKGNERMSLRAAYYPIAEVELGEVQGSGMLYIAFGDGTGHQIGDTISLYYKDGSFRSRSDLNIQAEGNKARVFIETGFDSDNEFDLHTLDESKPLWRILVHHRPDSSHELHPMGYVTIPAVAP